MQLYLSPACLLATDVLTAKASAVNIVAVGGDQTEAEGDPQEWALPEQFISRYLEGRIVTQPVEHTAA